MSDLDYWERNLEAALDGMDAETAVTRRNNADDLVVTPVGGSSREERAELIRALERRGFEVLSSTGDTHIRVDAPESRLTYPFSEVDREDIDGRGSA